MSSMAESRSFTKNPEPGNHVLVTEMQVIVRRAHSVVWRKYGQRSAEIEFNWIDQSRPSYVACLRPSSGGLVIQLWPPKRNGKAEL